LGQGSCINFEVLGQAVKDADVPLKLCALATCGTLSDLYHGVYDSSFIAFLRTSVFAGIAYDTSKQTIANIEKLDSEKVDRIIQKYLDFKN
jgi:hypothetical protein